MTQGWAIAHFENERSLIFALSLFLKERKSDRSFRRSFEKSEKRAIAHSLFCKEQLSKRSLICYFAMSDKMSDRSFSKSE